MKTGERQAVPAVAGPEQASWPTIMRHQGEATEPHVLADRGMRTKNHGFSLAAAVLLLCVAALPAAAHPNLSGHWSLIPEQSTYHGQPATQTGDITVEQRHGQLFISRHLFIDGPNGGMEFSFTTDGHEGSTIHQGKNMKTKAEWHGDTLEVKTKMNDQVTVEKYRLSPEGDQMVLVVDTPDGQTSTLVFRRTAS
jgi:hypothetical protein